ncbi:hypothetical protein [Silvanigrella aquatica]|uniref:Vitelline membrane outer layer protein I (VOMI) n=1 Tax=Silvanigrella aquatica TaxID=1915309 RepID=A0A1L4CZV9_9BACT|nr:hypothetical protein [Silvanigrella aquatica]APJ03484.1 hypothetical protein AXG55_06015 [Silvanigrella aquatica]
MFQKIFPVLCIVALSNGAFANTYLPDLPFYAPYNNPATDGFWGDWGSAQTCPAGQYVSSYILKSEAPQGRGDDTGLNGIGLRCNGGSIVTSSQGPWGNWGYEGNCNGPATGFQIQIERPQGDGDDSAANDVQLLCSNNSIARAQANTHWGDWSPFYTCPAGQVIIGLVTRVERPQGDGDDTALNGVRMICGNP